MLDFFKPECQSAPTTDALFGVCDDGDGAVAYIDGDLANQNNWGATVKNNNRVGLTFTAIDKCVIGDDEYEGRGRCDGMLTSVEHLYLIELKDKSPPWVTATIEQLRSTILFLRDSHNEEVDEYRHKKAFACNKRRPHFYEIDNELNLSFFRNYGFRIDVQGTILVV